MDLMKIDIAACRGRQNRLLDCMQQQRLDLVIVTQIEHVQWLTGIRLPWFFQPAAALAADGQLTVVIPDTVPIPDSAADDVVTYAAQWHSTLRNDQRQASSEALLGALHALRMVNVGVEYSSFPPHLALALENQTLVDMEPALYRLRRRKDPDELARIRRAIAATGRMYEHARHIIQPGISELEVFNQLQSAAVEELGEMLTATGNDYQCGSRGGSPRADVQAQAGQLYILDLGPAFQGYFADNCRTIAVTDINDDQQQAWEAVIGVLRHVEQAARPGKSSRELFEEAQHQLDQSTVGVFDHHLGHGIGLFPHEAPHLNPNWDDTFEVGDVFTAEPGLYGPTLNAGMRIENNYRVTEKGVELLTDFPLQLKL